MEDAGNQSQSWEASAPVDDTTTREEHQQVMPSPTPSSTSSTESFATDGSVIDATPTEAVDGLSSLNASVDTMWEARRAREEADRIAEEKLIEAVCAASLLEYNERNRAIEQYEIELVQRAKEREAELERLAKIRQEADRKKHEAMQRVIDAKTNAAALREKAKLATQVYEQKATERVLKEAEDGEVEQRMQTEKALMEMQQRKEEAIRRREEAELKARAAKELATAMRQKAINAAKIVRENSRFQIEHELSYEEEVRLRRYEQTVGAIEVDRQRAHTESEATARKAMEALKRAQVLQQKAEQARQAVRASRTPSAA